MSIENKDKTEAERDVDLNKDLEAAQDDVFGSDEEIAAQATAEAEAAGAVEKDPEPVEKTPEELEAEAAEKAAAEKADAEKTPEEREADAVAKAAADKETADKAAVEKASEEEDPYKTPADLKGRTKERFETLTGKLRESHELSQKQEGVIKGFREVIADTGMNQAELQETLNLGALMKKDPRKALDTLQATVKTISEQLGIVPPGVDPLEGHEDLKQRILDRELTSEDAAVIARSRYRESAEERNRRQEEERKTKADQEQQRAQQSQDEFKTAVANGSAEITSYLNEVSKTDPDYEKVSAQLVASARFAANNLAPGKWLQYIKDEYTRVKDIAQAMAPRSGGTPIGDGGAPPGGRKDPKTHEELADQML